MIKRHNDKRFNLTKLFLCLTLALAPLYVVRFRVSPVPLIGEYPTTLLEILIFLTTLSWVWNKFCNSELPCPPSAYAEGVGRREFAPIACLELAPWARNKLRYYRTYAPLVCFILAALISTLVSPDKRGALGIFKACVAEPILIYFVIRDVLKTQESLSAIFYSLLISGLWLSLLAILQGFFGWFVVTPHEAVEGRAHGIYNTANALGLYLGPLVSLSLGAVLGGLLGKPEKRKPKEGSRITHLRPQMSCVGLVVKFVRVLETNLERSLKLSLKFGELVFLWVSVLLSVLAIILSKSAGAMIGLAVSLLLFIPSVLSVLYSKGEVLSPSFSPPHLRQAGWGRGGGGVGETLSLVAAEILWKTVLMLPYVLFLATFLFVFLIVPHLTPYGTIPPSRVSENTTTIRLCLWEGTRNMLLRKPVFGAGLSGFKETYKDFRTCDDELLEYPHNVFLNFWAEMGLLGLISFLWLTSRWTKLCLSSAIKAKFSIFNFQFSTAFLVVLVYWLVHGLVDVPYFKNDLALEFWVILALLENYSSSSSSEGS